jgi:hypothetical protein
LLVYRFGGDPHGNAEAWEAHIKIEIRDEDNQRASFAQVTVSWSGAGAGSVVLESDRRGKIDTRLGPFSDTAITVQITNVELGGFVYRPALNVVSSAIVIVGPGD